MRLALRLILLSTLVPSASAQFDQFTWTLKGSPYGSGSVTPDKLHVVGPDGAGCSGGATTWLETVVPYTSRVSVFANYEWMDKFGPQYDAPAWVIDRQTWLPEKTTTMGWGDGLYAMEFVVPGGVPFGFGIWSVDCDYGPGVAGFHDLVVTPLEWAHVGAPIDPQVGLVTNGWTADRLGDIDGDTHDDFITTSAVFGIVKVSVISGADGAVLFSEADDGNTDLGTSIAGVGDLDGDGLNDFVAGAPKTKPLQSGAVHAWRSSDMTKLFTAKGAGQDMLGSVVAGPGDLDGDGLADVAAHSKKVGQQVRLLAGPDGHLLGVLASTTQGQLFGVALSGVGDIDLDGQPDLLVGVPNSLSMPGRVRVYSGATQSLLLEVVGGSKDFGLGVSGAGDLDLDGTPDLLVSEASWKPDDITVGSVAAYSGATGLALWRVEGTPDAPLGSPVDGGLDVTADGMPDLVTTTESVKPVMHVRSGQQGDVVAEFADPTGLYFQPTSLDVVILGDVDGTGSEDVALSGHSVHVFKALDGLGAPSLAGLGHLAADEPVAVVVSDGPPGTPGLLLVGYEDAQLPLLGGVLQPLPVAAFLLAISGAGIAEFHARWPAGLPQYTTLWMQAWILDPAGPQGWTCTNGLIATQLGN